MAIEASLSGSLCYCPKSVSKFVAVYDTRGLQRPKIDVFIEVVFDESIQCKFFWIWKDYVWYSPEFISNFK